MLDNINLRGISCAWCLLSFSSCISLELLSIFLSLLLGQTQKLLHLLLLVTSNPLLTAMLIKAVRRQRLDVQLMAISISLCVYLTPLNYDLSLYQFVWLDDSFKLRSLSL
jgi:hypothetical protein